MSTPIELTILMPCLNEALTVAQCVRQARAFLAASGIPGEVLVADNGSTDGSQALAEAEGARVVAVPVRGYGAALRCGIEAARGRFVVMGDSDCSYDFSNLHGFVAALRGGKQLVMGNRFAGGIAPGAMPGLHRYLGNPVLSFVGRLFFKSPVHDFHCGLRGFERGAMLKLGLQSSGMEFASEMVVKATLHGLRIAEVPTTLSPDGRDRPPHLRSWRDGWRHLRFLLLHAPAWLFMYPGIALFLLGTAASIALGLGPLPLGFATLDVHSMLYAATAACLGLQMLMFAGACSLHAVRIGVLPQLPTGLGWVHRVRLEPALLSALMLLLVGLGFAGASVWLWWQQSRFGSANPAQLMRLVIPGATFMLAAGQVAMSAFMFEFIRMVPQRPPQD
ncbi:glycosyltransferase family 2 protein [Roseateles sp.]|uniref:glycosyltransferase family 2 protein n=1 Tax=Roseateles sp. TaxID=1971397 RepID=UPI00326666EF